MTTLTKERRASLDWAIEAAVTKGYTADADVIRDLPSELLSARKPAAQEKIAPVQGYTPGIPWSLHLEAYDASCKRWSPQPALIDLDGRYCRGGFGRGELDEFIPCWRDRVSEIGKLRARVAELEAQLLNPLPRQRNLGMPHRSKRAFNPGCANASVQ